MTTVVVTFSVLAGKIEICQRFCQEMSGSWQPLHEESRRRLGITHERLELVETSFGSAARSTLEVDDVGLALSQMMASEFPFDCWYRTQIDDLHVDNTDNHEDGLKAWPLPERQELLFEWTLSPNVAEYETWPQDSSIVDTNLATKNNENGSNPNENKINVQQIPEVFEAGLEHGAREMNDKANDQLKIRRESSANLKEFPDYSVRPDKPESEANVNWTSRVAFLETPLRLSTLILSV